MGGTLNELRDMHHVELKYATIRRAREGKARSLEVWNRKLKAIEDKIKEQQRLIREAQMRVDALSLDIASRTESINKHRVALTKSKTNKEYAAILSAMNTEKADTSKIEGEALLGMEQVQTLRDQLKKLEEEKAEHAKTAKVAEDALQTFDAQNAAEMSSLEAKRDALARTIKPGALQVFIRAAQHHDGEAMAAVERVNPKREDYVCLGCNMNLTLEVVNALHTRQDDLQLCGACGRILYLPDAKPRSGVAPVSHR